jgi:hypothetical protein
LRRPVLAALSELPRVWPSIELPGHREHLDPYATYSPFAHEELPPIGRPLDDELRWLLGEPLVPASLAEVDDAASTPATLDGLERVAGPELTVPGAFAAFVGAGEAQARIRSCTDCYLDLGDLPVPVVGGGRLVHFLSDSQWVLHWLLYVAPDGSEAVVATDRAFGFELAGETVPAFDPAAGEGVVCAESFAEFLYRFWIENEIWFALGGPDEEPRRLTPEQQRYAEHYGRVRPKAS